MRLIDADALKLDIILDERTTFKGGKIPPSVKETMLAYLDKARTIEPKQGEWIEKRETNYNGEIVFFSVVCSCCGLHTSSTDMPYCPNCGARMKGAGDA